MAELALQLLCCAFALVFFWSGLIVPIGLLRRGKKHPRAASRRRFAVLVCARDEARVIERPVRSALAADYPRDRLEVIVLADNCTDATAERARSAGATVWEKTTPSAGKGDVLAWGVGRVLARGDFDACAVFDADNVIAPAWFDAVNDALTDGETVVTGRRSASNVRTGVIPGWYGVYWGIMNELSNRVRTNLGLSGKLTGTGFAFLLETLPPEGWRTHTLVEDVEFSVQGNLRGHRVAYVPDATYADEQPETVYAMWRQLRRWATGGWQVARGYMIPWIRGLLRHPSPRLFDSYFAVVTGMAVAFVLATNLVLYGMRMALGTVDGPANAFFSGVFVGVFAMSWTMAAGAVALSARGTRPGALALLTFPVFSLILTASVLYTLVFPTRRWKPIRHGESAKV